MRTSAAMSFDTADDAQLIGFYDRVHSGEVMSRLTADTTQIKSAVGTAISQSLRNSLLFFGALIMMVVTSPAQLAGLVFDCHPSYCPSACCVWSTSVRRLSRDAQDTLAVATAYAQENLGADAQIMQSFNNEPACSFGRFGEAVEECVRGGRASAYHSSCRTDGHRHFSHLWLDRRRSLVWRKPLVIADAP